MADYRVNEIGAIIFTGDGSKPSMDELLEQIDKLDKRIAKLEEKLEEKGE